jgi:putative transposase
MLKAYKYQIKTDKKLEQQLLQFAGSCRFVFNKALALQQENYRSGNKFIGYVAMAKLLTAWRHDPSTSWLSKYPVHPMQQALKDLDRAYVNFFAKRAEQPKFKKKGQNTSFRYPDPTGFKIDQCNNRISLPKIGWVRYRNSRVIKGVARNITVGQSGGRWYVSILTDLEIEKPVHPSTSIIGIDVGIAKFATLSDGIVFEPINSFKKHQKKLARYQQSMSRKQKFSSNWKKAKAKINKLHSRIANVRKDHLHKTSTTISKNHAIVCIEDLKIRSMTKSAKGNLEKPGINVKAKSELNKSILDQGWFEFRRQLEYKEMWTGGRVVVVPPQNTSRKCNFCGHTEANNRKSQAKFKCITCGYEANADVNAARNILAAGHVVLACGEIVLSDFSMNQEPSEATWAFA